MCGFKDLGLYNGVSFERFWSGGMGHLQEASYIACLGKGRRNHVQNSFGHEIFPKSEPGDHDLLVVSSE